MVCRMQPGVQVQRYVLRYCTISIIMHTKRTCVHTVSRWLPTYLPLPLSAQPRSMSISTFDPACQLRLTTRPSLLLGLGGRRLDGWLGWAGLGCWLGEPGPRDGTRKTSPRAAGEARGTDIQDLSYWGVITYNFEDGEGVGAYEHTTRCPREIDSV